MLSDRDALLAAICANPEEDTPRLMFADWLDENGEPERGEFVRLQCEQARLEDDGGDSQPVYEFLRDRDWVTRPSADWTKIDDGIHRRIALAMRAADLLRRHGDTWLPKLPKRLGVEWTAVADEQNRGGLLYDFRRGFPHRVTFDKWRKRELAELAPRLREAVPAVTLVTHVFNDWSARQLADAGLLGSLGGLDLGEDCWAGLAELGRRPEAAGVRELTVHGGPVPIDVAPALADGPHWTRLHTLDLSQTAIDAATAEALFRAKNLRTLRRLTVRGLNDWTADTARVLAAGGFTELTSLRLAHCGLDDDAAEALAGCPHFQKLRRLDIPHNNLTGRGVTALLTSPHLANVAFLGIEGNPGNRLDGKRLAAAQPGGLRMLHAHGCRFITADVRKLARCPRLRTLWYLDLDANNFGTPAVRELIQGFGKWCPPILWLTYNRIDDRGAELLAKWKAARALRVLHLKHNSALTDAGIRALLDSPHLADLDGLGVSTESAEMNARLRARFRHHDIDY